VILSMYWEEENENQKKQRLLEERKKRKGMEEAEVVSLDGSGRTAEEVKRQNDLIDQQRQEIGRLAEMVQEQSKVLGKILENQGNSRVEQTIIYQGTPEAEVRQKEDFSGPQRLDVKIISTEGFETRGEAGAQKTAGSSIADKLNKLKELEKSRLSEQKDQS